MLHIIQLDIPTLEFIKSFMHTPFWDHLMKFITTLGNKGFIWIVASLSLIARKKHRKTGLLMLASLILSTVLGEGLFKHLVGRPRPFITYPELKSSIVSATGYSFPSGHTTASFAAAGILISQWRKSFWTYLAVVLASGIAFSRLYFCVHYPTDIYAGIILGLACSLIIVKLSDLKWTQNWMKKYSEKRSKD